MLDVALASLNFAMALWLATFAAGAIRNFVLSPQVGPVVAVLMELAMLSGAGFYACRDTLARFEGVDTQRQRAAMGLLSFAMLIVLEIVLMVVGSNASVAEILESLKSFAGMMGIVGRFAFALFPPLVGRLAKLKKV